MTTTQFDDALRTIRRVWAGRVGVSPGAYASDEPAFVDWTPHPVVVAVRLGATTVVAAPEPGLASLRQLSAHQLLESAALLAALDAEETRLLGTAQLSFADPRTFTPRRTARVREASRADVEAVTSACSADEREECGLADMETWWVAEVPTGQPVAAAGYEIWDEGIAHVGVAVAPHSRGHGLGADVAGAAAGHALRGGLIPQWRSAGENAASAGTGKRLGFVPLGAQLAIDLEV